MSRLIVLSNRVKMPDNTPMAGGLAVALHNVIQVNCGIWMGWNGDIIDTGFDSLNDVNSSNNINNDNNNNINNNNNNNNNNKKDANEFSSSQSTALFSDEQTNDREQTAKSITYMTTSLTPKQYQHYYCGFANSVLWALLHEQPSLIRQAPQDYAVYQDVNQIFARQLKEIIEPEDVIWVHDYHFLSVAYYCRQLGMTNRIGFFLHIPFAPLSLWKQLDESDKLIHHLAHYDVLGIQTKQDKANCVNTFEYYLKDNLKLTDSLKALNQAKFNTTDAVQLELNLNYCHTHCLTINAYPIGVNVAQIQKQVSSLIANNVSDNVAGSGEGIHDIKPANQRIVAVDRIDYSKGLLERFSGYQYFLQQNTLYQKQLKLVQIACPSRLDLPIYRELQDSVRRKVQDVNEQFDFDNQSSVYTSKKDWQPINYSESILKHDEIMTLFYKSDIGWVNSLKDGMNLVAKEYIAAQNPANPGVLVLSRYAGAAEQMQAAVIIDPYHASSIAEGLKTALQMPLAERKRRYQALLQGLQERSLCVWQQDFLNDLIAE